jgi:rubrerythrin
MSPLKTYQSRIVYLLTQQELLIAEIYRFFAGLFPERRDFWEDLARDQMEHATWVEYFYKKAASDTIRFEEGKIKTYTVESFVKYLEENLAKVKEKAPTLQAAFSLALNIENSLLVRRVFELFLSSDPEMIKLLKNLQTKLKAHRSRIEDASGEASSPRSRGR